METKANHIAIGAIALALLGALMAFAYWVENKAAVGGTRAYTILFDGPVTGLGSASDVLFNGIPVGKVRSLSIDADDSRKVRVEVAVSSGAPIRVDSRARIVRKGLGAPAAILITAGGIEQPLLGPPGEDPSPVILAIESADGSLFDAAPRAMERARTAFDRLERLLRENEAAVARTISNFEKFSGVLAENQQDIGAIVRDTAALAAELRKLTEKLDVLVGQLTDLTGPESAGAVISEARAAAREFHALAKRLDESIGMQADSLSRTAKRSLNEFELFMKEGRRAVRKLESVLRNIEQDPSRLIFGGSSNPDDSSN